MVNINSEVPDRSFDEDVAKSLSSSLRLDKVPMAIISVL